jgi:hypothetical protein
MTMLLNPYMVASASTRSVTIKGWAGAGCTQDTGAEGGAGGAFVWTGTLDVGTVLTAEVGQGGQFGPRWNGGGRTRVWWTGNEVAAGAGGGGAAGAGGAGGGTNGQAGSGTSAGGGGTQSAGGAGGVGGFASGSAGAHHQGGDAPGPGGTAAWPNGGRGGTDFANYSAGGGGDGHYGGGGGGGGGGTPSGAGGGGSGYDGTTTGTATLYAGSGTTPGNSGDSDRGSAGSPVVAKDTAGNNGRVVIIVDGVTVATLTYTGANQAYTIV